MNGASTAAGVDGAGAGRGCDTTGVCEVAGDDANADVGAAGVGMDAAVTAATMPVVAAAVVIEAAGPTAIGTGRATGVGFGDVVVVAIGAGLIGSAGKPV
jgi:hypothetical protein